MCQEAARQHAVAIDFTMTAFHTIFRARSPSVCSTSSEQAIDNAVQHSGTRNIAVDLRGCRSCKTGDGIQLKVIDDGIGFDPEEAATGNGLGLIHIRERLTLVNGELLVESRPGTGTTVSARVPIPMTGDAPEPRLPLDGV